MKEKIMKYIKELGPYIIVLVLIILIKLFVVTTIRVNGPSMYPTLHDKDIMILDEARYHVKEIKRFDIVVLDYHDEYLIKRVIGLPGDKIEYKNNKLYVNGKHVKEKYAYKKTEDIPAFTVPKGKYYVLGDNRVNSTDSRLIGCIPKKDIRGVTNFTIYPFNRFGSK